MRPRHATRVLPALAAALLTAGAAACGGSTPEPEPASAPPPSAPAPADDARIALAARAAAAEDHRFTAMYNLEVDGREPRSVLVTVAVDGTWRVDIPAGALGGTADVSIAQTEAGVFQCALPSVTNPITPTCVRVAEKGKRVPKKYDPKIERVFRQWLPVFTDRQSALSVTAAAPLKGSSGSCFSIDTISTSLSAPVDVGIYCYADDGLLTAARVRFGRLTIASTAVAPPPTIDLPGPVTGGEPMGLTAPPPPPVTLDPSASAVPAPSA
jgi:hypothetical protein